MTDMNNKLNNSHAPAAVALLLSLTVAACCHDKPLEISSSVRYSQLDDESLVAEKGCIEYDSIVFSDNSYAVMELRNAPQNMLTRYVDSGGRLMATVSAPSETYAQRLVYGYDDKGRLRYLLRFDELGEPQLWEDNTDSAYLGFRMAIDSVDFHNPDTTRHTLTEMVYGDGGWVSEIRETPTGKCLAAPEGYRIEVKVDQCVGFWSSDLDGGRYLLKADIVPISAGGGTYFIKRFVDFMPTTEMHYAGGRLFKSVCHPNPSCPGDVKETVTLTAVDGANIYTKVYGSSRDTLARIWKGGLLREEVLKSEWGTILCTRHYTSLPSGMVRVEERNIDFKTLQMKPAIVTMLPLSGMPHEEDEMNPLKHGNWMEAY